MTEKETRTERLFVESLFERSMTSKNKVKDNLVVNKLTGDASTRRYFRITNGNDKFIACLCEPGDTLADFLEVQNVLKNEGVDVPEIFDQVQKSGYLLQEDLGNITLLKKLSLVNSEEEEYEVYKRVIEELIKIHKVNRENYHDKSFTKRSFDSEKYKFEYNFTMKYFVGEYLNVKVSENELKRITEPFKQMERRLSSEKFVLTHRDFHSRNVMCLENRYCIIDFQDARMGIPQYDLVSLLEDCYYNLSSVNKLKMIDLYWENFLSPSKLQGSKEHFLELYDLMTIQRTFKAIGSFCYIFHTRKDERYLKYIGYSFEKLRKKMSKFNEFKDCRKILSGYYYEH